MILASLSKLSRLQFALTAMYHWLFVPLTIGLGFIMAIMESRYVRTGDPFWKKSAKFWMKIFAVNFAIGVATGIILEFQFGTNWSNYSWFVGDIFGAPLAIEGIFAFFLESTFFAIMFFGWNKVSKRVHLLSTWLVAIGTILSAFWILIANGWMQFPVGMVFNPDSARNEMVDFWAIVTSPVALNKFLHTVANCFVLGSIVVIGISSWYLLKKREERFALSSIRIASIFGLISLLLLIGSGDGSAFHVAKKQPMKLAAMEGLYRGEEGTPIVAFGLLNHNKRVEDIEANPEKFASEKPYLFKISIPYGLSLLVDRKLDSYVPGIEDILEGGYLYTNRFGEEVVAPPMSERMAKGKLAIEALANYKEASTVGNEEAKNLYRQQLEENFSHFGYGFLEREIDSIPNIPLTFYSFHLMVALGFYFLLFLAVTIYLDRKRMLAQSRWFHFVAIMTVPLVYLCSELGWVVSEVGRQPWTIQDLLTVNASLSGVSSSMVATTTTLFFILFTLLLAAELTIMFKVIKKGPQIDDNN